MRKFLLVALLCVSATSVQALEKKEVIMNDMEYTNEFQLALRKAQHNDKSKSFDSMLKYAKYGEKVAQFMVGNFYLTGIGTKADPLEGLIWMGVALEQKVPEWQKAYDGLTAKLPADQIAMLQGKIDERKALYGVKAQHMSCVTQATVVGSNMRYHVCNKKLDSAQRVTVVKYSE
jgi:TPR repeat protein